MFGLFSDMLNKFQEKEMFDMEIPLPARLKIKYGLIKEPNETQISQWINKTDELINSGKDEEEAGNEAAKIYFPDYNQTVNLTKSENLRALLAMAKKKHGK